MWRTRSTQTAQTSLAEADHYSHIAHYKNVLMVNYPSPPPPPQKKKKKKKKSFGSLPAPRSGYATTIIVFFVAHLLILEYLNHHQNLITSSLYYPGHHPIISSQSVHNFLSNVVHKQTNQCHLCQGGNDRNLMARYKRNKPYVTTKQETRILKLALWMTGHHIPLTTSDLVRYARKYQCVNGLKN